MRLLMSILKLATKAHLFVVTCLSQLLVKDGYVAKGKKEPKNKLKDLKFMKNELCKIQSALAAEMGLELPARA